MEINKSEVGILIAVRMKSSRLKSKALAEIVGKPLIVHLIERMSMVKNAEKVVLCTSTHPDDCILLDVAADNNIDAFAGDELDVMKRFIDSADLHNFKYVVRVTGDNPLTDPDNIDRMIEEHIKNGYNFTKSEHLPLGVNAEVISLETLKKAHNLAQDSSLTEYMTSYLKRPDIFNIHTIENNEPFFKNRERIRLTVDFDEDLQVMNHIYGELYDINPKFKTKAVLEYLDSNQHILKINDNMLEIPLPKIKFKGETEYDKKMIIIGNSFDSYIKDKVETIKKLEKYEIVGFFNYKTSQQYSLIDGIPTLGDVRNIEKVNFSADYFIAAFADNNLNQKYSKHLSEMGLKCVEI